MVYYEVLKQFDQKRRGNTIYIQNELYTENEVKKLNLNKSYLQKVEYPKNKSYRFFGARFNAMQGE